MNQNDEATKMLVTLLARERALFRPYRGADWSSGSTAARWELQQEFRLGLRWTVGGSMSERKAAEQQTGELRKSGLIETNGKTRGRHVRLTYRGRQVAEILTDHPGLAEGHHAVTTILRFAPAGQLVSELLPAELKNYETANYQEKLFDFQFIAMPAIVTGWLEAESDCHGRVAYCVTLEGERVAAQPQPKQPDGEFDEGLLKVFMAEYEHERERLLTVQSSRPNETGPIPLAAGGWSNVIGPWSRKKSKK